MDRTAFLVSSMAVIVAGAPARASAVTLEARLTVRTVGSDLEFTVTVRNHGELDVPLHFTSAARVALVVRDGAGTMAWNSLTGRMFASVLATVRVPACGFVTFAETWSHVPTSTAMTVGGTVRSIPPLPIAERHFTH